MGLEPGYYVYVGSAFVPGGVAARVSRHLRKRKPKRWHIDYLRTHVTPSQVYISYDDERREHQWARALASTPEAQPVDGFGCSDCTCRAHLFYLATESELDGLSLVFSNITNVYSLK